MAESSETVETARVYDAFIERVKRRSNIGDVQSILNWDQEVMMPAGGTPARSKQLSTVSAIAHELLVEDPMADWLETLRGQALSGDKQAIVREVGREYERAEAVPTDLIEAIAETTSNAHPKWKAARREEDFDRFAPILEELVELKREYAAAVDPDEEPYAVLFSEYEPYLSLERTGDILSELRDHLVPMLEDIRESSADPIPTVFEEPVSNDIQEDIARSILDSLGYDWDRGRLDTAPHPFSSGNCYDARVTTRFDPEDPFSSILSTIHEFGHACYTQGLDKSQYGTPLASPRDLSVHESQSRLWENHVGRSRPFWETFAETIADHIDGRSIEPEMCYRAVNEVDPTNLIRVEADELSYHLHIIVRFEIERALINGDIEVAAIPSLWNDKMEAYLGVRPETDAEGCLQDIHWSHGSFGYFPTYSLGSVLAAQLFETAERDLGGLDADIAAGDFAALTGWLREHIHQHGKRYRTDELIRRVTGEDLTAAPFTRYVEEKFGEVYRL